MCIRLLGAAARNFRGRRPLLSGQRQGWNELTSIIRPGPVADDDLLHRGFGEAHLTFSRQLARNLAPPCAKDALTIPRRPGGRINHVTSLDIVWQLKRSPQTILDEVFVSHFHSR
jgi:hypothetical protein